MKNIPKNQRIVTKQDIRDFHIIYNYYMWSKFFKRGKNLFILFKKNYILDSSIYKSINIYDLMIFNNFTIDELSKNIFNDSNINKQNSGTLIKSFYLDLKNAFNNKKEINKLNRIYSDFETKTNFTYEILYEMNEERINELNKILNFTKLDKT